MPTTDRPIHLRRLSHVWDAHPVYYLTVCIQDRRWLLANDVAAAILIDEWRNARTRHGWSIGRYTVMPDHVHFFAAEIGSDQTLAGFMCHWKEWTAKRIVRELDLKAPIWQRRFFDHVLRSHESRSEKWNYVRNNPVRANLVKNPDDWPYQGFIDFE